MKLVAGSVLVATMVSSALLGTASQAGGQAVASSTQVASRSSVLQTEIALNLKAVSLVDALREIQRASSLQIAYAREDLPRNKTVTVVSDRITVANAIKKVLEGTGVTVTTPASDKVVLVKEQKGVSSSRMQGVITGKVTDAKSGRPIPGATVSIGQDNRGATTGEDGLYRLASVGVGTHTVSIRFVGYAKQTRTVTVGEGATLVADFKLEPSANVLDQVVVTGTIVQTELKAVPNAITVITAKQIEERGITRIDQLFRGDVPGLFAMNLGSHSSLDEVTMFSRGATALSASSVGTQSTTGALTNPIKTYVDGIELADSRYLSQIDPRTIDRIEILAGPQASTIYGSNALNGVMQIFTKRGSAAHPQLTLSVGSGFVQNNFSSALAPNYSGDSRVTGVEGRWSYNAEGSVDYAGSWTPAKNTSRYSISGGSRMEAGKFTSDISVRRGVTQNRQGGSNNQVVTSWQEDGLVAASTTVGLKIRTDNVLNGQTVGLTLGYAPGYWWSSEIVMGQDMANVENTTKAPRFGGVSDTLLTFSQTFNSRASRRYSATSQFPILGGARVIIVAGGDHWDRRSSSLRTTFPGTPSLTGTLANPTITRDKPDKNMGGFFQGQIGVSDAFFVTYGLRAEWNPNYGDEAQPNFAPRYGAAYTRDVGVTTIKLRASYGRSTRPPTTTAKLAGTPQTNTNIIGLYGPYNIQIANPELGPEFQQGGEGGIELYAGNRGSLIITRYNQTVDALIGSVNPADSVRSLVPFTVNCVLAFTCTSQDVDGYGYRYLGQNMNIGSVRNQGWETQVSINAGPFVTKGVYSWTKSRVIGITPQYRALFAANSAFQLGRPFSFLAEHTWALDVQYGRKGTSLSVTLNGNGQMYKDFDDLRYNVTTAWRDLNYRSRMDLSNSYRQVMSGYVLAHLNASHRFSTAVDGTLQVRNLTDSYHNDFDAQYSTAGRQANLGLRIRM